MDQKELNKTLRDQARSLGLCDKWYDSWKNESPQELIDKYLRGIDFCIEHDYPSIDFIKKHFPNDLLLPNSIFVDAVVDASNLQKAVLIGKSEGQIVFYGQHSSDVYVRHQSKLKIQATGGAKVFVETYDDCIVDAIADEYSKVFVYDHGGTTHHQGNVVVRNRKAES